MMQVVDVLIHFSILRENIYLRADFDSFISNPEVRNLAYIKLKFES